MTEPVRGAGSAPSSLHVWGYRAVVWSALLSAVAYLVAALWGGGGAVDSLQRIGALGVVAALGLSLVNYLLRFVRWQIYLRAMGHSIPAWPSLKIYLAGFALTTTPAKAGEALRGLFLKPLGVPYATSLAAMLSERISDMTAILALSLLGLAAYPGTRFLFAVGICAIAAAYLVIGNRWLAERILSFSSGTGRIARLMKRVHEMLTVARACHVSHILIPATLLSFVAWGAEALAFHLILQRMGVDIGLTLTSSIYGISILAGAASFLPGGLGGTEAAMVALLRTAGVGMAHAISGTLVIRVATLWFAVGLGLLAVAGVSRSPSVGKSTTADGSS